MSIAASPIRYPDATSSELMTRRAWWLVVLNFLIPGSPQVLAGNRRMGRFGLGATLVMWALAVVLLLVSLFSRSTLLSIFSQAWTLWVVAAVLTFYAVLWAVLTLDTLRLVRIVKTAPSARVWIAGLTSLMMVFASGTAAYGAYLATTASGFLDSVFVAGPSVPPVDGRYNFLLLGGDAGPDRQGMRPDSTTVISVDAETGHAVAIGLPRDLQDVPFPAGSPMHTAYPNGYGYHDDCNVDVCQLNSIYTEVELKSPQLYPEATKHGSEPGIEAMRDAAEGITGLKIQYYVLIDMYGFQDLIDSLGGVDINVPEDVPIHKDATFTTVAEWIKKGPQHLDGWHALWYARSRHGTSDYDRMARQRQLQEAVIKQFNPANVLTKFQDIAKAGKQIMKTDVPQSMLGYFVDLAAKGKSQKLTDVELVPPTVDPTQPDFTQIHQLVHDAIRSATPTPTPSG